MVIFIENIESICVKPKSQIKDVLKILEKTKHKIVLVESKKKLVGIITDGDIRKSLLKKFFIDQKISHIMNKKPKVVIKSKNHSALAFKLINEKKYIHIPLVDQNKKLLGLYMLDLLQTAKKDETYFFIMAGGRGERLKPITNKIPKPMIKISNKPLLEHILVKAKNEGFINIYLSINYLGHIIRNYFKNGEKYGLNINYIEEKKKLGTIGSLSLLNRNISKNIVLTNADVYTKVNYKDILNFHVKKKSDLTIVVKEYLNQIPYGVVNFKANKVLNIKEKPINTEYINAGIYVISSSVLKFIPQNEKYDSIDFIKKLILLKKKVTCFLSYEKWIDIGSKFELEKIKFEFQNNVQR